MEVLWDGPTSTDRLACPCDVNFVIKPGLAQSLNSLESGRLILTVSLDGFADVREVWVELVNNARLERLDISTQSNEVKSRFSVSAALTRIENGNIWAGEIGIPGDWIEGCSMTYERTGSFTQTECVNVFSLKISYLLPAGMRCTARFTSQDAYHWSATK